MKNRYTEEKAENIRFQSDKSHIRKECFQTFFPRVRQFFAISKVCVLKTINLAVYLLIQIKLVERTIRTHLIKEVTRNRE